MREAPIDADWREFMREFVFLQGRTQGSARRYTDAFRQFQKSGPRTLAGVTPQALARFAESKRHLKAGTRDYYQDVIASFLGWATKRGRIRRNPMADLSRKRGEAPAPRPFAWEEARGIVEACRGRAMSPRDRMLLLLLLFTGARGCEIVGLQRADLDIEEGRITLTKTKSRKARAVYVARHVRMELREYVAWLDEAFPDCPHLFPRPDGRPMNVRMARGLPRRYGHPVALHRFRHTYATEMLKRSGGNLRLIQTLLGHQSPATTARYLAVYDEQKRAAAELLQGD